MHKKASSGQQRAARKGRHVIIHYDSYSADGVGRWGKRGHRCKLAGWKGETITTHGK
jgi:hypothetical protein